MKKLILVFFVSMTFFSCSDEAVNNVKENTQNTVQIATIIYNSGLSDTIEYTNMEYTIVLDNGYGFAFTKNGVFVKSYLTENIQSIITTPKE